MNNLLKPSDVAERLNVSMKTVRRIINKGELIVVATSDDARGDRIEPEELERFIQRKKRNRSISGLEGLTTGVVIRSGFDARSTEERLDKLLGQPRKRKRRKTSTS